MLLSDGDYLMFEINETTCKEPKKLDDNLISLIGNFLWKSYECSVYRHIYFGSEKEVKNMRG